MRVAHVSSEVVPFAKSGGLADVLGALPPALAELGAEVTVVTPAHRTRLDEDAPGEPAGTVEALGLRATVRRVERRGVQVLLIDCPALFVRPGLYGTPDADFPDNPQRFAFFARAALQVLARLGRFDVVNAHDWQAALVPLLLRVDAGRAAAAPAATVLTVHNLGYQGVFDPGVLPLCGLPSALFTVEHLEFWGRVNFLKGGLTAADALTTVSPTYAREILTPQLGCGLEGVLAARQADLIGILNGLDVSDWDPRRDPALPRPFGASSVVPGKSAARAALASTLGAAGRGRPLAAMVSRLAEQKGADLVAATVDRIVEMGFDLVVLGSGEPRYADVLAAAEHAWAGRVRAITRFDEALAHLIYGAADVFLMPSRYEPCGLGQMIAMRYGALPVAHRTGGLADTIVDVAEPDGTGILFEALTVEAFVAALARARDLLGRPADLAAARRRAMKRDFSWKASARRYLELYERLAAAHAPA